MRKTRLDEEQLEFARALRRSSTDAENLIWRRLRGRQLGGLKFRREHPIGPFVLDFFCSEKLLAIEVDGGQHYESAGRQRDRKRDEWLRNEGILVLRFSARAVLLEPGPVLEQILLVACAR